LLEVRLVLIISYLLSDNIYAVNKNSTLTSRNDF